MQENDDAKCVNLEIAVHQAESEFKFMGHIRGCKGYIATGCIDERGQPACTGYTMSCYHYFPYGKINKLNNQLS